MYVLMSIMRYTEMATSTQPDFAHSVTRPNTRKHWTLYTLDAWESKDPDERRANESGGATARALYDFAAGDDSIVFRSGQEVSAILSELRRKYDPEPVERRTDATTFDGMDVEYQYRLSEYGRKVLLDLGAPDKLPNRRSEDYDRELDAKPGHKPGWWLDETERIDNEWDIHQQEGEWVSTDHPRVFYKSEADNFGYGEFTIASKLAEMFEDVFFVITCGPYRPHDMAYAIRDPFEKVVQLDIYSPMFNHRNQAEITAKFEELVHDLMRGLANAGEVEE